MLVTKPAKTVTDTSKLSPRHLVSNIRHQHRFSHPLLSHAIQLKPGLDDWIITNIKFLNFETNGPQWPWQIVMSVAPVKVVVQTLQKEIFWFKVWKGVVISHLWTNNYNLTRKLSGEKSGKSERCDVLTKTAITKFTKIAILTDPSKSEISF